MNPRTRAMLTIGIVITILTLFFLFVFVRQQRQVLSDSLHNEQQSLQKQMNLLREQTAQRYKSRIKSLVTNRKQLVGAFAKKDRAELLKQAGPLLELFKNENLYFKGFFFANPDNTIFLRVTKPELYGDDVTHISHLIQEGNRVKKMVAGFEIIKCGLSYRILHPVFLEQKYIGLIGFSIDADFFLDKLHKKSPGQLHEYGQTITDIALVFPKAELSKTVFLDKAYKIIGDYVIFPKGNYHFQKLQDHIDLGQGIQRVRLHDVSHALIHSAKFKNFKGDLLAEVLALVDIDTFVQGIKYAIVQTIIVACSLLFLAFVVLYLNFSLLFKKITTLNNLLEQTNKELEHGVEERTAELKESEQRFRTLFNEAPDAIFTIAMDDRIIEANAAASRMLGYKFEEFQTMTLADLQAPEIRGEKGSVIRNELTRDKFFEGLDIHKDGTIIPIEVHNQKMRIKGQEIVLSLVRDITQRKQAEEELKKGEERLKAILGANPDPVVVYDFNGYPLYLNPAFTEIFSWNLNELQGRRIPFVPGDQQKITALKIKEIYEFGNPVRFETKRLAKHGKTIDVLLSAAIIKDSHGINTGLVVNLTDITEQKKIEDQLRQSQKMEAIGSLAGGIAHDFNNILSGIFGYAQLTEMNLKNPDKAKESINQVLKGAKRASELVRQILTFSRHNEHKKSPLQLFLIVKEAVKFLRSSIPATIEIQEKILSRATVLADPTQAHQVVMNLCTNAYHAVGDSRGTLFVELNDVEIKPNSQSMANNCKPGNYVKLEIRDTGHGMDKKTLEKIFDPYFTTKKSDKGTGLGLSVVDGIVKKHNGFIKADSKPGHGSKFQVFWPVIENKDFNYRPEKNNIGLPKGTEQIMLVDDETDILVTTRTILERQGYKVVTFENGPSALQAFAKDPGFFDLVITDMSMPRMAGDELATNLLKIRQEIPIVLCTGFSENMSEEKARSMGIKGFLMKPIVIKDLSQKIREVLGESQQKK